MLLDHPLALVIAAFCLFNASLAFLFWLHEKVERSKMTRLRYAVEKAVRAVEQVCEELDRSEKKQEMINRVQALLGLYKWLIPALVIDTAIEAELFVVQHIHDQLSVDHDTPEEVKKGEGSA